ncbi:MAG: hypothetical protein RLY16_847 [Bacteroidota bacterium]
MRLIFLLLLVLLLHCDLFAQNIATLIKEAEKQEALLNERGALDKFREALKLQPNHLYVLNKCSELCSRVGKSQPNAQAREDYYNAAQIYAGIALKFYPKDSEANCLMAIALGRITLNKKGKDKINSVKEIKRYVDASLLYNPNNYKAWHVLGRWHYELSNLNVFERAAIKLFFGGMPKSSFAASVSAFEKAAQNSHEFILNYFELAKAYYKNDQEQKAIQTLKYLLQITNHTAEDEVTKQQARDLLKDWQ